MASTQKKLVTDGSILFASTLLVNAGNYAINLVFGRWLGPSDFSEVSLLVTLILMVSFFALAFQLTAAKYVASYEAEGKQNLITGISSWLNKRAVIGGIVMMVIVVSMSVFWQDFFQTSSYLPFAILGIGMPFYMLMSVNRGILQGKLNYKKLALTYQSEMWVRLIVSMALVYLGYRVNGVAWGLTLSLIATWWISRVKTDNPTSETTFDQKDVLKFLLMILLYECSQILINNSDIILVKHFYEPEEAGLYAAMALIGRIVYFGTWTVVTLLFPIVVKLEKEGKDHTLYFVGGLAVVGIIAAGIVLFSYLFPEMMVNILFGEAYISIAPLLWKYALATALFALSNVFVYYHISLDRVLPVWITILGGIAQIVLISLFHADFEQIINVQIYLMMGLMTSMILFHFGHSLLQRNKS
ncbi:oligosaccharide flippase family protein [Arcticibacterium luteifluviistationis]|uniref:Sugar isomerase n=1 Tax=Arcticibacterium luteifluviistationis TaxID=1784714 RepID=A0A2Z4GCR8_9BACT|nr:oligosaccharide flippase family protein [Arcticibacterium luteifluviistationis]AWV99102.1 sugar isomerase [Arcticibacterium luteifluviistationis]